MSILDQVTALLDADSVPRLSGLRTLGLSLADDDRARLAADALAAQCGSDYDLSTAVLNALTAGGDDAARRAWGPDDPQAQLALHLSTCVFKDVRLAAVSSGLLSDDAAATVFASSRTELRKAVAKAFLDGKYTFAFTKAVSAGCDVAFGDKASLWKIQLGADPVAVLTDAPPSAALMVQIAKVVPVPALLAVLKAVPRIGAAGWLVRLAQRAEVEAFPEADVQDIIRTVLYAPDKWMPGTSAADIHRVLKYLWRRQGHLVAAEVAAFNADARPSVTLAKLLELSRHTSWNQQLEVFQALVPQLRDYAFADLQRTMLYMRKVNKSSRSSNCDALFALVEAVTSPHTHMPLLDAMRAAGKFPPQALVAYVTGTLLPNAHGVKVTKRVFTTASGIMQSCVQRPANFGDQYKHWRCPTPVVEFLENDHFLRLLTSVLDHKHARTLATGVLVGLYNGFVVKVDGINTLRAGVALIERTGGRAVDANMLLPTVQKMRASDAAELVATAKATTDEAVREGARTSAAGLPLELLRWVREPESVASHILLERIADAASVERVVNAYGRDAFWSLLEYGFGGQEPRVGPTKAPQLAAAAGAAGAKDGSGANRRSLLVATDDAPSKPDEQFDADLEPHCYGHDLMKRRSGLANVLRSCNASAEFRRSRIAFVVQRTLLEPDHTKQSLVPLILNTINSVQEFVLLAGELVELWERFRALCARLESPCTAFTRWASATLDKVVEGLLPPDTTAASLAADVMVAVKPDAFAPLLVRTINAAKHDVIGDAAGVRSFLAGGFAAVAGHSNAEALQLVLQLAKRADVPPAEVVAQPWATPLADAMAATNDEFVMCGAMTQLTAANELHWTPVAPGAVADTTAALLARPDAASTAMSLVRRRLVAIGSRRHALMELSKTDEAVAAPLAEANAAHCDETVQTVLDMVRDTAKAGDFDKLLHEMFCSHNGVQAHWSHKLPVDSVHAVAVAFVERCELRMGDQQTLSKSIVSVLMRTTTDANRDSTVEFLTNRPDAVAAVCLSSALTNHVVKMRPSLLEPVFAKVQRGEELPALARALRPHLLQTHVPKRTAAAIVKLLGSEASQDSTVCLACVLREVDCSSVLAERILEMSPEEATVVLNAAVGAGHPRRTVKLVAAGTALKETSHRALFERGLRDMPSHECRSVAVDVLQSESTGPSVAKLCLRLASELRLERPLDILMTAWRSGTCHRDVLVYIMAKLAVGGNGSSAAAVDVFGDESVVGKRLRHVAQELMSMLEGAPWDCAPMLGFLDRATGEDAVNGNAVLGFLMPRLCLSTPPECVDEAMRLVCSLLERGGVLSDKRLHGVPRVASGWDTVTPKDYRFLQPAFHASALRCPHATVQRLMMAMGVSRSPKVPFALWANAMLRDGDSAATLAANAQVALEFAGTDPPALRHLCVAAVERGVAADNDAVRRAALHVVVQAHAVLRDDDFFIEQRAALAAVGPDEAEMTVVLDDADAMDAATTARAYGAAENLYAFVQRALAARGSRHLVARLTWLVARPPAAQTLSDVMFSLMDRVLRADADAADRVADLMFPHYAVLRRHDVPDKLFSYSKSTALRWVERVVAAEEEQLQRRTAADGVSLFSHRVAREATQCLLASAPPFRVQVLRYLPVDAVRALADADADPSVRAVARHLVAEADKEAGRRT